ncbi:hypothetical protein PAMP_018028 [Pampus punctatissimus]
MRKVAPYSHSDFLPGPVSSGPSWTLAYVAMVRRIQEENAGALSTQPTEPQSAEPEVVNTSNKKKRCKVCRPKMDRKTQ